MVADAFHSPLAMQVMVLGPLSMYPALQLYFAEERMRLLLIIWLTFAGIRGKGAIHLITACRECIMYTQELRHARAMTF